VYDVAAVAEALDLESKQLDNLLSRNELPGVDRKRRGVARRLTPESAVVIGLARELANALAIPVGSALSFAEAVVRQDLRDIEIGTYATLRVDLPALRAATYLRLDAAVELVGRRRRGRPQRRPDVARPTGNEERTP
jgi:hypothetical protein